MEITFSNPQYLWFLAAVPLLVVFHFYSLRFVRQRALRFSNFEALEKVAGARRVPKNYSILMLRVVILACFVLAAAGAILWHEGVANKNSFVIAVDTSASMLATDIAPDRLAAAKAAAAGFLNMLPPQTAEVGVVSFSGVAVVKQPLSPEVQQAAQAVSALSVGRSSGTAIGDAIVTASNLFRTENEERVRQVVILTDGENNAGTALDDAVEYARENSVLVNTIGIGTTAGGALPGTSVPVSRLDEDSLQAVAARTGGKYYRATDAASLDKAFSELAQPSTTTLSLKLSAYLLLAGLLCLFIEWILSSTKYRALP